MLIFAYKIFPLFIFLVHEGYGEDNQNTLEPFPFSQPVNKEKDDAELRRQLKSMGKGSLSVF